MIIFILETERHAPVGVEVNPGKTQTSYGGVLHKGGSRGRAGREIVH